MTKQVTYHAHIQQNIMCFLEPKDKDDGEVKDVASVDKQSGNYDLCVNVVLTSC